MSHLSTPPLARLAAAALFASACCAGSARAQDLEPRAYAEIPVGLNFALLGYGYSNGAVAVDASAPLKDGRVETNGALVAYARSLDVFGNSGKIDVVLPWAGSTGSATLTESLSPTMTAGETRSRHVTGFADPRFRFSVNLYGAPALTMEQYADYVQDVIIGASLQVTAPLGQYDSNKLLNLGTHRWTFKPEVGISKEWKPFILELSTAATIYTNNDDFFHGHRLQQDPLYSVQAHGIYTFGRPLWGALDFTYYTGGKTTINNVSNHDRQTNTRVGATLALALNRYNSIKLHGSTGLTQRTKNDFQVIGIAWQVRWGAGL